MLERARFGSRSERLRTGVLSEEQYALVFEEIETSVAAMNRSKPHRSISRRRWR
ncbi:hypothetical protein [Mesorhizobium sp.]|uniref:hypothetical protein n=1 Tax=Mesorhizobium sp. TaxID=1871066 RepID=UPI003459AC05